MRVPVDGDSGVSEALKERRAKQIERALKKIGLDSKVDLMIWLTGDIQHGEHRSVIRLNPNVSDKSFFEDLAHELLHYQGLNHSEQTRELKFSSTDREKDLISKVLARMLQGRWLR